MCWITHRRSEIVSVRFCAADLSPASTIALRHQPTLLLWLSTVSYPYPPSQTVRHHLLWIWLTFLCPWPFPAPFFPSSVFWQTTHRLLKPGQCTMHWLQRWTDNGCCSQDQYLHIHGDMAHKMGHAVTESSMGHCVSTTRVLEQDFLSRSCFRWTILEFPVTNECGHWSSKESGLHALSPASHFHVTKTQGLAIEATRHPHPCTELYELYLRLLYKQRLRLGKKVIGCRKQLSRAAFMVLVMAASYNCCQARWKLQHCHCLHMSTWYFNPQTI